MALPVPSNTTCDIYRVGNAPPAAPDVAGVKIYLIPDYARGRQMNEGNQTQAWTHIALLPPTTDIRDVQLVPGGDLVWIPDKNGTRFIVKIVTRKLRNEPMDHKVAYLQRNPAPTWPTDNL